MRTTLSIDDDVLTAAKALATHRRMSLGQAISDLARQALKRDVTDRKARNGVPLLPIRADAKPVTPDLVNTLRDEAP